MKAPKKEKEREKEVMTQTSRFLGIFLGNDSMANSHHG